MVSAIGYAAGRNDSGYFESTLNGLRSPTAAITAETPALTTDLQTPGWLIDALDTDLRLQVTGPDQRYPDVRRNRPGRRRQRLPERRRP